MKTFNESSFEYPTLILESNIDLEENLRELLLRILKHLPSNYDVFFLSSTYSKISYQITPDIAKISSINETNSYIIKNSRVSSKLINLLNK